MSSTSPRRSPRHAERKAALVAAARSVVAERGIAGANVRAVAEAAEVSAGNVLYYFSSFDDLIFESIEAVVEEFAERRRRLVADIADPAERIRVLVAAGIPDEVSGELRVLYESLGLIRTKPHLRPLGRSVVERQVMLYLTVIEIGAGLGEFTLTDDAEAIARNIVALEDAYDMYPVLGVDLDRARIRRAVLTYAALALGCPRIAEPE